MAKIDLSLSNLDSLFPAHFSKKQVAVGKTTFLKEASLLLHRFYSGKIMTVPKAGSYSSNWFNVWYTPASPASPPRSAAARRWPVPGVTDRAEPEEDRVPRRVLRALEPRQPRGRRLRLHACSATVT